MTPKRKQALDWVARNGVPLLPGKDGEPTNRMLVNLEIDGLVEYGLKRKGMCYYLTRDGIEALEEVQNG